MRQTIIFLFAVMFFAAGTYLKADEVTFKAAAPEAVVMGQQFRLTYTLNVDDGRELRIPDLIDFDVLMGPTSSVSRSIQFVNGVQTSSVTQTFTYILMPKKEGTFNLAPATVKAKNANYTSNALVIKVLPPDPSGNTGGQQGGGGSQPATSPTGIGSEDLFVRMSVSNRNVYEQEGFLVTFKIYSLVDVAGVPSLKFPEFEGFLSQDIEVNPQWTLENHNGRNYRTAVLKQTFLYPQHSGKITIESGKFDVLVRMRTQKRIRSIFDDFFDSYQDVKKELASPAVTIDVKPLPSGKPASFNGAVGNYTMKTSVNTTNMKVNEAVTVTVNLSGSGNIRIAKNPEVAFPNDFEVYDPKVDTKIKTTTAGTSGTKTIEYMAIPRYAGDFEIPSVTFSYFDPKDGTYKTLRSDAYSLHVEKGASGDESAPVMSNFTNRENVRLLGQDIRYIKVGKVHFLPNREIFFGSLTYILIYITVTLLFIAFFVVYRKQMKENANIALVRTKKANKTAVRRLKKAEKQLKENRKESFYDETLRAVWGYLSDKLNIPLSHLTKDNVGTELFKYGVEEALSNEFMDILNTCEFARYAPSQAPDAMDHLFKQAVSAIGKMENTIKK
ncbi:MAG: BatD family protein [Tannerella sp.]|nr:BatD family protein [Tannerella sp.]